MCGIRRCTNSNCEFYKFARQRFRVAQQVRGLLLGAAVFLTLMVEGCRSLRPSTKVGSYRVTQRHSDSTYTRTDTSSSNHPQRLLPLRVFLDLLSQRHTAIESRLDSLELNLAEIRRIVEQLAQEHRLEQSNEDTLIAGPKVSGSFSGEVRLRYLHFVNLQG
jgi:hypothetical protein